MSRKFVYYGAGRSADELLLDLYPATAAYSLRKLRITYTGSAIRVRRSSDNTEMDIGFDGIDLDTTTLLSFVGAGNGFVTTWYDQQGSNNVNQGTAERQPRIVNSGVVELENSIPSIRFIGSTFLFESNILSIGTSNDMMSFSTARTLDTNNSDVFFKGDASDIINAYSLTFTGGTTTSFAVNNTGYDIRAYVSGILTNQNIYTTEIIRNTSNKLFRNGSQVAERLVSIGDIGLNNKVFSIGALMQSFTNPNRYLNGNIQEIVIYHSPILPSRTEIETNINTYYGIY